MTPFRHSCGQRLLDLAYPAEEVRGREGDIAVKCPRCSRREKRTVVVGLRLRLPRYVSPTEPTPIHCVDPACLARVADVALAHTYTDRGDVAFRCPRCKAGVALALSGVVVVE